MSTFVGVNCCLRAAPGLRLNLQKQARALGSGFLSSRCINTRRQGPGERENPRPLGWKRHQQPWRSSTRWRPEQQARTFFGPSRVVTNYVDLPPGYEDEEGLPFGNKELDQSATARIFGGSPHMTPWRANKLLRILHGRRVAGSLEDPEVQANTASFTDREMRQALEWLRANVPVDEITNAGLRAEDELWVLEGAPDSAVSHDGTPVKDTSAAAKASPWSLYKKPGDENVYGESIIDKIRARNVARREAEEKALEEKRRHEEEAGQQNWGGLSTQTAAGARQVAMSAKEEAYRAEATSSLEAPPDTPMWRLLLPTTIFVAALLPLLWWGSGFYTPPPEDERLLPWLTQEDATVYALMLANLAVFVAWRRMGAWKFMNKHAIMDMVAPRPTGAVAAIFSHQVASHLAENMFVLWLLGGLLLHDANRAEYLAVFLGSGAAGFLASLYKCVLTRHLTYGLGASSAIFGVICAYFWIHRFEGFKILDLPPDPANGIQGLGFIGLIVGLNLVPLFRRLPGQKDWVSHLAGIVAGIGFAELIEKRRKSDKENKGIIHPVRGSAGTAVEEAAKDRQKS
jgi:rhomboid-like protein